MTTYSKDTRWGRKYRTDLHLIYEIKDGRLETEGLYETRETAEKNLALINEYGGGWQIADVTCRGWGIVDGQVEHNEKLDQFLTAEGLWRCPEPCLS